MIVSTGEQVSVGLVGRSQIRAAGVKARSFLGHQCKIVTDQLARARGSCRSPTRRRSGEALAHGEIAVRIAGFQARRRQRQHHHARSRRLGYDRRRDRVPRSKPTSAQIYTDVDGAGPYTADPNVVPTARKVRADLVRRDARARVARRQSLCRFCSVELGMKYVCVRIHVRSSFRKSKERGSFPRRSPWRKSPSRA